MDVVFVDKYEKNMKYRDLMTNLKKSIKNEFYYEAIFIEYAILEDRTESILRHANISTINSKGQTLTLNLKLSKIQQSKFCKYSYVKKHLTKNIINAIYDWKNDRNKLIHDLIKSDYSNESIKNVALNGYELIKKINNKSTLINKYNDNL